MLRTILLLLASANLAFAQSAVLVVLNKADHNASFIDPVSMKVLGTAPTGVGPHEAIASSDGKLIYVANYGDQRPGSSLSVLDVATRKELRKIEVAPLMRPHGIIELGGHIYFSAEGSRAAARYNVAQNKVDWIAGTGQSISHMIVATKDGSKIYVANIAEGTVTFIDVKNHIGPQGMKHIKVGQEAEGIDISPDGREVWVATRADGNLHIIDTATNAVKKSWPIGRFPIRVKFTPDGKRVLVSNAQGGDVVIVDAATQQEIKRIAVGEAPVGIQISNDGKWGFVAASGSGTVSKIDLDRLEITGSVKPGDGPDGMAWAEAR